MPKRSGENLARTEDGATYNKLQRPDEWPQEPARSLSQVREDEGDSDLDSDVARSEADSITNRSHEHIKHQSDVHKPRVTDHSCLPIDDDDFSGSEENDVSFAAIQYLKSVRAQASDLPDVHAAFDDREREEGDHRGYYEDGTYTVAPQLGPSMPDYEEAEAGWDEYEDGNEYDHAVMHQFAQVSACEAYTNSLLLRFHRVREIVRTSKAEPPAGDQSPEKHFKLPFGKNLSRYHIDSWKQKMLDDPPDPSQLATASLASLRTVITIVKESCLQRKHNIPQNISLWILVVLASIDEDTIGAQVIFELRELAKKAIWLRIDFEPRFEAASEAMAKDAGYVLEIVSKNGQSDMKLSQMTASEPAQAAELLDDVFADESLPDETTRVTLDMIVVLIGEIFGQRDLLESRAVVDWPAGEHDDEEELQPEYI